MHYKSLFIIKYFIRKEEIIIYNLHDNSGYGNLGGSSYGGGAGLGFSMPVSPSGAGMPICMPMGGCNNGFGGDGLYAILLLALLGRGGFGNDGGFGGNSGNVLPTVISDNINGRFSALSDQIAAGDNSVLAAISQNGIVSAVRDVDSKVCDGFLQTQKGFGDVALENCRSTGLINTNINQAANGINTNITAVGTQGLLAELRTQAQLSDCCCRIENAIHSDGEMTRGLITQNTIQDLRDKLVLQSQKAQTADIVCALSPKAPVQAVPVSGNQNLFPTVVSASGFCGFGNSSFNQGNCNVGNGCF